MKVTAQWKMSKEYYKSYWHDWIQTISKGRRWTFPLGMILLLFWTVIYFNLISIPVKKDVVLFISFYFGIFVIAWHFWDKRRWFNRLLETNDIQTENKLVFTREVIEISGPHSRGTLDWGAFKTVVPSKNGLFFVLQKGISIYVPDEALDVKGGKTMILEMFNQNNAMFNGKNYDLPPLDFDVRQDKGGNSYSIEFLNDDKTPMSFVVDILEKYFGLSRKDAVKIMLEIHANGKAEITGFEQESVDMLVAHIEKMGEKNRFPFKCNKAKMVRLD